MKEGQISSWNDEHSRGEFLRDKLGELKLSDLDPTFKELRSINRVMLTGWGKGPDRYANDIVEKLLKKHDAAQEPSKSK
jgi:hypothetical protein